jgi:hypothetical protein
MKNLIKELVSRRKSKRFIWNCPSSAVNRNPISWLRMEIAFPEGITCSTSAVSLVLRLKGLMEANTCGARVLSKCRE